MNPPRIPGIEEQGGTPALSAEERLDRWIEAFAGWLDDERRYAEGMGQQERAALLTEVLQHARSCWEEGKMNITAHQRAYLLADARYESAFEERNAALEALSKSEYLGLGRISAKQRAALVAEHTQKKS